MSLEQPGAAGRGRTLLAIARASLAEAFGQAVPPAADAAWLLRPGASFVTLLSDGELRGCVGTLEACRPLGQDVRVNAQAAAFRDPRFSPLQSDELARIAVEVSVLSALERLEAGSEEEAIAALRPGVDGVCLTWSGHRGTFLPQVWESLPEPRLFLARLKEKAGLAACFWDPALQLFRYSVEKWSEAANRHAKGDP